MTMAPARTTKIPISTATIDLPSLEKSQPGPRALCIPQDRARPDGDGSNYTASAAAKITSDSSAHDPPRPAQPARLPLPERHPTSAVPTSLAFPGQDLGPGVQDFHPEPGVAPGLLAVAQRALDRAAPAHAVARVTHHEARVALGLLVLAQDVACSRAHRNKRPSSAHRLRYDQVLARLLDLGRCLGRF